MLGSCRKGNFGGTAKRKCTTKRHKFWQKQSQHENESVISFFNFYASLLFKYFIYVLSFVAFFISHMKCLTGLRIGLKPLDNNFPSQLFNCQCCVNTIQTMKVLVQLLLLKSFVTYIKTYYYVSSSLHMNIWILMFGTLDKQPRVCISSYIFNLEYHDTKFKKEFIF